METGTKGETADDRACDASMEVRSGDKAQVLEKIPSTVEVLETVACKNDDDCTKSLTDGVSTALINRSGPTELSDED